MKLTASSNNFTTITKMIASFLTEKLCLNEDIVKESLTNVVSYLYRIFSQLENKYPHNPLSSCCFTLFVRVSVCRQLDINFSHSKSHTQIQNPHGPLCMPMLSFISFVQGVLSSEFPPRCHPTGSFSLQFSNWK